MNDIQKQNRKLFFIVLGVVAVMIVLAYASVPLYRLICQQTGWGGTVKQTSENGNKVYDRVVTVRFDAMTAPDLPWVFKPDQQQVEVKVGADTLISYSAESKGDVPVSGMAVYNVTPLKAGKYFNKTQCFCFNEQVLRPGEKVHMPVSFFIDPQIMDDKNMDDVHTITLSYTFYRQGSDGLSGAMEKFYDSGSEKQE